MDLVCNRTCHLSLASVLILCHQVASDMWKQTLTNTEHACTFVRPAWMSSGDADSFTMSELLLSVVCVRQASFKKRLPLGLRVLSSLLLPPAILFLPAISFFCSKHGCSQGRDVVDRLQRVEPNRT